MPQTPAKPLISLLVPMHNEEMMVSTFYQRIRTVLDETGCPYELVCINDGSRDDTLMQLIELHRKDSRIKVLDLSRNFGKESAMTAGMDYCTGDVVIPIDADLQDPPELIHDMLAKWREGYDVVYATRIKREGETFLKKNTAQLFYRVMQRLTPIEIPTDTGDFRLMSRQVVEALKELREQHRFMKGLFSWVGFKQVSLPYYREPRHAGESKFNYWRLWNFALEGITSFSIVPLQLSSFVGLAVAAGAFAYAIFMLVRTILFGNPVQGYPSLIVTIAFLGGFQLMSLGIIGEYVGRIYNETKHRPLYFVRNCYGFQEDAADIAPSNRRALQ